LSRLYRTHDLWHGVYRWPCVPRRWWVECVVALRPHQSLDSYDARGLLQTAALGQAGVMRFGYDAAGRRTFVSRPNGVRTEYTYDDAGQLQGIQHKKGSTVLASYAYVYDANGLRTQRTEASGRDEVYGYDTAYRLRRVDIGTSSATTYTLDALGNRTAETKTGVPSRSATYNLFNQQTESPRDSRRLQRKGSWSQWAQGGGTRRS